MKDCIHFLFFTHYPLLYFGVDFSWNCFKFAKVIYLPLKTQIWHFLTIWWQCTLLDSMLKFRFKKFLKNCAIIYCQQNSSFLFLSLLYKLTFSENCPIYFMTKYFNIFNVFLPNFYKIKFYNCSALVSNKRNCIV